MTFCIVAGVPRIWNTSIESHRAAVRQAILDTTATLVAEGGVTAVSMSQIAERAGIGRATLYKYFPDVETILVAWHHDRVAGHIAYLTELQAGTGDAWQRLQAVLVGYAQIVRRRNQHHGGDLSALVHRGGDVLRAEQQLADLFSGLLTEVAQSGQLRGDVPPKELAQFCMHSLGAAGSLGSEAAVRRLVTVTLTALEALPLR